ncbi:MAG: hypothetical protein KDD65_02795 [Bacteroidetes bacterium]|nr:hypothetical protein [Bacteroidota bacterium]
MNKDDFILRFLDGRLSVDERHEFDEMMADPSFRQRVSFVRELSRSAKTTLSVEAEKRLDPFFTDRLMKTVNSQFAEKRVQEEFLTALLRWFSPMTAVSLIIIVLLVAGSLSGGKDLSRSVTESVFGLPAVTVANAYDLDYE